MINPIVIIITASVIVSIFVICVINKPKKPIITGTIIFILICYVVITFVLDNAIAGISMNESLNGFVGFLVMTDTPSYEELADSFRLCMMIDIVLIIAALLSLFSEIMLILRKDSRK